MISRISVWVILIIALINPVFQYFISKNTKSSIIVLQDNSLSMAIKDKKGESRFDKSKVILNSGIFNYFNKNFNLQYFLFNRDLKPAEKNEIFNIKIPDGDSTDIGGALTRVSQSSIEYLDSIIILSDGINNVFQDMAGIAGRLKKKNIRVFSIKMDDNENLKDISLTDIECPSEVNINSKFSLNIKVNALNYNNTPISLQIFINDKIYTTYPMNLKEGQNRAVIPVAIKEMGINKITITCQPKQDESILLNNSKTLFIRAIKNKFKVLLVYGQPSFEYKFLKLAMENDPNILSDNYFPLQNDLNEIKNIAKYDLIILGNIAYKTLPQTFVDNLLIYANNAGGAMLFLGGRYAFKNGGYQNSKLKEIIPIDWDSAYEAIKSDFTLKLTPAGMNSQALQIINDLTRLQEYWDNLPPCNMINSIKKVKKGADIMAVSSKDPALIVLAMGKYKRVKTGIFTAFPTWKWGFLNIGIGYYENPFNSFWQQLIRYMVNFNLNKINLFTNKLIYKKNEDISATLALFDDENRPVKLDKIPLTLFKKVNNDYIRTPETYTLYPSSSSEGVYEGALNCKEDGEYKLKINFNKYKTETFFLVQMPTEELFILKADNNLLNSISRDTGGKFLGSGNISQLKNDIKEKKMKVKNKNEENLWSNWFLLILVIGLLSAEWFLRKKNGLL